MATFRSANSSVSTLLPEPEPEDDEIEVLHGRQPIRVGESGSMIDPTAGRVLYRASHSGLPSAATVAAMRWAEYIEDFHQRRAGITERVLARSEFEGRSPYAWMASAIPGGGRVLDVACGSAPLAPLLGTERYIGLDASAAELELAARRGDGALVRASAAALPFPDAVFEAVTCSMALQVLQPLPKVVAEISRVLAPGGRLIATVPATGPLRGRDVPLVTGLVAALGRRIGYPNDRLLDDAPALLSAAGLHLVEEAPRRFVYRLRSAADAEDLFASLYLPGLGERRARAGRAWLRAAARLGTAMPIPIRRIIAARPPDTA